MSLTFMAKPNQREGNSCHIHFSLRTADGDAGDGRRRAGRPVADSGERVLAGLLAHHARAHPALRAEHQLLQAVPARARSRRPRCAGAWTTAPARCGWSGTGRRCGWRTGCPGGDVNPYLAIAGMVAGGAARHRARARRWSRRSPATPTTTPTPPRVPATLRDALALWEVERRRARRLRRRGGGALRQHRRGSSWPPSTRRSPTGSCSGGSSDCDASSDDGIDGRQPGDRGGRRDACRSRPSLEETDAAIERAQARRSSRGGGVAPGDRAGCCAGSRPLVDAHIEELAAAGGAQLRAHHRQRPLGGRQRPRRAELLRRRAGAAVPAGRSRCPAGSTSPSTSRSASSA